MHIEYWICDRCKKVIDYDEKTKYTTTELGYPFIPKNGGGKHFHYVCLLDYYNEDKKLSPSERAELIKDAERRHNTQIEKKKLKKGNLTSKKFKTRKATKEDRESLINYFYNHYGLQAMSKRLGVLIDRLNEGENYGNYKNIHIPYFQLEDMLIYYGKELTRIYNEKLKKESFVNPLVRINCDIAIVVNNLSDYITRRELVYNEINNNKPVDGGGQLKDDSERMKAINLERDKQSEEELQRIEMLKQFVREELDFEQEE